MGKQNCWEFKKCGKELNGAKSEASVTCPAATAVEADGFCDGKNGGRACVYISGTYCSGIIKGTQADISKNCAACDFYKSMRKEEGSNFNSFRFIAHVKSNREKI